MNTLKRALFTGCTGFVGYILFSMVRANGFNKGWSLAVDKSFAYLNDIFTTVDQEAWEALCYKANVYNTLNQADDILKNDVE